MEQRLPLHGSGGPLSPYSVPCGNGMSGGEKIIPMTNLKARDWLEAHYRFDELEKHFGKDIIDA